MISRTEAGFLTDSIVSSTSTSNNTSTSTSTSTAPIRADGRTRFSYRPINLIDQVSLQSNGSARCQLRTSAHSILTDVIVGCKLEVEERDFDLQGARVECSVDCPPAALIALPQDPSQLYTSYLNAIYSPLGSSRQLRISSSHTWAVYIDAVVVSASAGNAIDVICMAVHKALSHLRIPKTAEVTYQRAHTPPPLDPMQIDPSTSASNEQATEETGIKGLLWRNRTSKTKTPSRAFDFELADTDPDHGDPLLIKESIPIAITINLIDQTIFLDATLEEESISCNKLIVAYTEGGKKIANVIQAGAKSEIAFDLLRSIIQEGAKVAEDLSRRI